MENKHIQNTKEFLFYKIFYVRIGLKAWGLGFKFFKCLSFLNPNFTFLSSIHWLIERAHITFASCKNRLLHDTHLFCCFLFDVHTLSSQSFCLLGWIPCYIIHIFIFSCFLFVWCTYIYYKFTKLVWYKASKLWLNPLLYNK